MFETKLNLPMIIRACAKPDAFAPLNPNCPPEVILKEFVALCSDSFLDAGQFAPALQFVGTLPLGFRPSGGVAAQPGDRVLVLLSLADALNSELYCEAMVEHVLPKMLCDFRAEWSVLSLECWRVQAEDPQAVAPVGNFELRPDKQECLQIILEQRNQLPRMTDLSIERLPNGSARLGEPMQREGIGLQGWMFNLLTSAQALQAATQQA